MTLADVTRAGVLAAVAEFDRQGRNNFLRSTGFGHARTYFLEHDGRLYDSKAITGYAHAVSTGSPLEAKDFSGGDKTVAQRLTALGFTVRYLPYPDWTRDEIIVACALVEANEWKQLDASDPRVRELSGLLQSPVFHPPAGRNPGFRNPASVARKTHNIASVHPAHRGAPSNGNRLDREVLGDFLAEPTRMRQEAARIRAFLRSGEEDMNPPASPMATLEEVLEALQDLHPQERPAGLPKRHQPLTLLWAIGRARQGQERLAPWPVARTPIGELIDAFGHPTDRPNAYLPFLALNHTDLWELTADPPPRGATTDARRQWLTNTQPPVKGGLPQRIYNLMATDRAAAAAVVTRLLDTYFKDIATDTLLEATGLSDLADDIHGLSEQEAAHALMSALARDSAVVDAEASNVESTEYERMYGTVVVRRGEAQLVGRYMQTLPPGKATRLQLAVGWTDLYDEETGDIIEAKVSAEHSYVRQALGQLLDYAAHCTLPLNRLTALFPEAPAPADIYLLHLYGIDCVHWAGGTTFHRLQAPAHARERIRAAWSAPS